MNQFRFKLRGRVWRVIPTNEETCFKDPDVHGLCVYSKATIYVRQSLDALVLKSTLWHEIQHAILEPLDDLEQEACCNLNGDAMLEILPQLRRFPSWAV